MAKCKTIRLYSDCMSVVCILKKMQPGVNADVLICNEVTGYSMGYIDFKKCKLKYLGSRDTLKQNEYKIIAKG